MDRLDLVPRLFGHQIVMDGDQHFSVNASRVVQEGVQRVDHAAVKTILDGDQTVIDMPANDGLEYAGDVGQRDVFDAAAEFPDRCGVRETAGRAEEADAKFLFQREAAAHDFAVDSVETTIAERAAVELTDAFQDGFFAVGGIDG